MPTAPRSPFSPTQPGSRSSNLPEARSLTKAWTSTRLLQERAIKVLPRPLGEGWGEGGLLLTRKGDRCRNERRGSLPSGPYGQVKAASCADDAEARRHRIDRTE